MAFQAAHRGQYICICLCSLLLCQVQLGLTQVRCYSTPIFSCDGTVLATFSENQSQECCSNGYLSLTVTGTERCFTCSGNVICHSDTLCMEPTDNPLGLGAMSLNDCCVTSTDGMSYVNSGGQCTSCPPRPTTAQTSANTQATTTSTTDSSEATTETSESGSESNTNNASIVGAVVGGVIGVLVLIAAVTAVTIVIIVVVIAARR